MAHGQRQVPAHADRYHRGRIRRRRRERVLGRPWQARAMETAAEVLSSLLANGCAFTLEEMDEALRDCGQPPMTRNSVELLLDRIPACTPIVGDRWVNAEAVLRGRMFTHPLSAEEQASDILLVEPDLVPADGMVIAGILAVADDPVVSLDSSHDAVILAEAGLLTDDVDWAWLLPDGALQAFQPLAALGVRILAGGALELSQVTEFDEQGGVAAAATLTAVLREHEAEMPVPADSLLLAACVVDPEAFRSPVPPVAELFAQAGIARRGAFVAFEGFDFDRWEYEAEVRRATLHYGLDEVGARAAVELSRAVDGISSAVAELVTRVREQGADLQILPRLLEGAGPPDLPPVSEPVTFALRHLADADVATAVLAMTLGSDEFTALPLTLAVAQWRPCAPRASRCALGWLEGKALERLGEHELAERSYDAAESIDPAWTPVLIDLARFASDRGDAVRAVALLERAGVDDDDDERVILARFATEWGVADRNAPCWCGSGRRVKACHRSAPPLPLEARASWLHHKAVVFLHEGPWRGELLELGRERSRYWSGPDGLLRGLSDALVHDVMLCEGAVFEEFLEERGYLLPDDERELAETWIDRDRSVFDVEDVVAGESMTLRDMRSGERVEVSERLATHTLRRGMIIVTRVLPCGGQWQVFGGIEQISLQWRDGMIDVLDEAPEPIDVIAALTAGYAPPSLTTTTGEPLTICRALVEVEDVEGFLDLARDRYQPAGADWVRTVDGTIRATMMLENGLVRIETLSEERMDEELDWATELSMFMRVVEFEATPLDELTVPDGPSPGLDLGDPAVAEVLAQVIAGYEESWLDESIPALGGLTPREAAEDPTRQPDLVQLLASLQESENGMSPSRLAAALGLDL